MGVYDKDNPGSLSARVFAVGPFSATIAEHMPYSARHYNDVSDGQTVVRCLFDCWIGDSASTELADCFGIDPWDFSEHKVNAHFVDQDKLRRCFPSDYNDFVALRTAGFSFYYMPHCGARQ